MRVLHLSPGPARPGGIATYSRHFAASLRTAGVEVESRDARHDGVGSLAPFDLVHVELGGPCRDEFWAAERLARTRERPFVATLHDPPRCAWRPFERDGARGRVPAAALSVLSAPRARRVERFVASRAAGLLLLSCGARPGVLRTLRLPPETPIRTMPHPVTEAVPVAPAGPQRADGPLVAGFHGYWFGGKGIEVLLDAIAMTRDDAQPVRARLWGESVPGSRPSQAYRDRILRRIEGRGLADLVEVEGPVPEEILYDRLREADVIVLPHRSDPITYRGLAAVSGAMADALAAGVPVVASAVRAFAEQVRPGVDGLLVAPDDPSALAGELRRLRDDRALLARLRAGARDRERRGSGEVARALYEEILAA